MDQPLASLSLDPHHVRQLSRVGITKVSEIWTNGPTEVAKKLKITQEEFQIILDAICVAIAPKPQIVSNFSDNKPLCFTTGDTLLDKALGGGVRAGTVTEICGESSAGKTQLALQLALTAQLDRAQGGLECGAAYFTTSAFLPVTRLAEIARSHSNLQKYDRQTLMDNIHNCSTPTVPALLSALKTALVQLFKHVEDSKGRLKPIRLLIIDSLGSLFHSLDRTTTTTLVERSKILGEISYLLHSTASSKNAAVIVLNQVSDVFHNDSYFSTPSNEEAAPELIYRDQSVWFNRPSPLAGLYPAREATLGLTWANQLNTRIMLSRTRRRQRPTEDESATLGFKRRKGPGESSIIHNPALLRDEDEQMEETGRSIRNLSVIFSASCSPCTMDFVILREGIHVLEIRSQSANKTRPPVSIVQDAPKPVATLSVPLTQGFISARLTQRKNDDNDNDEDIPVITTTNGPDVEDNTTEDFDAFDAEEWANYGVALEELEEQWDVLEPEPEPGNHSTSTAPSPGEGEEEDAEILESSDVEENFLLDNLLEDRTQPNM
ncbi:hypothetical protein M408DRAFT_327269 [Serendipita vermifera MAFF 305830]|uniref:RecA family profile 1 domain-containing protein n=1 Tax=Serendipita vermifera MAFF 305830 TaxID=933852 RepID=A0A0C2X0Q1_SERVB|nr:hypothetical protein M408DRAFT_327269 [Serendipita vermifera MAFF 305830]